MLSPTLYVKIKRNRFEVRCLDSGETLVREAVTPFTTERILVGQFDTATDVLKPIFRQLSKVLFFTSRPKVLMHQVEMAEGGLSEVEERVLVELAFRCGARNIKAYTGEDLGDAQVKDELRKKRIVS
jgi:rod shape-determining protein MreB and related proteins